MKILKRKFQTLDILDRKIKLKETKWKLLKDRSTGRKRKRKRTQKEGIEEKKPLKIKKETISPV